MKRFAVWLLVILGFVAFVKFSLLSHSETCQKLEVEAKSRLHELAVCQTDSDCTFVRLSCPYDCVTALHRNSVDPAMTLVSNYNKNCMMVCPECPKFDPGPIRCMAGFCVATAPNGDYQSR
jgi:hypothetical protein